MGATFINAELRPPCDCNIDELIANKLDYNASATVVNQSSTESWMTPDNTFVLNGVERVPLIQEVKARNAIYISCVASDKGLNVILSPR